MSEEEKFGECEFVIKSLEEIIKFPAMNLPWTWREDLPVMPIQRIIDIIKNIKEEQKSKEKKFLAVMEKCKLSKTGTVFTSFKEIFGEQQ